MNQIFTSDDWLTPPEIIHALGTFDLDPATPLVMPWLTATNRFTIADADAIARSGLDGKFVPLIITFKNEIRSTWRQLVRWLLKECGGVATIEQLYALAADHPKALKNPNWKAKIRQTAQQVGNRVGPARWSLQPQLQLT